METKGLLTRRRSKEDERNLIVTITKDGEQLKERAADIPAKMVQCFRLESEEAAALYRILYKMLDREDTISK